jgi:hypothetical protein
MKNGIVGPIYQTALGACMTYSRPKPHIICLSYCFDKKKGQATCVIKVACPFFSYFIKANKSPFRKRALHKLNLLSGLTGRPGQ